MDKKPRSSKRSLRVFEEVSSSRENTPDPFSDDGEYGSDEDYDPKNGSFSDSDDSSVSNENAHALHSRVGNKTKGNSNSEYSDSGGSASDSDSDSTVSIFDSRQPKKRRRTSEHENTGYDTANADTISVESPVLPVSPSLAEREDNPLPLASSSLRSRESNASLSPERLVSNSPVPLAASSAPVPEELERNPESPAPLPEEMESNPGSPAPLPEEMESNPGSPAPLPEEVESNPGSPAPLPEEMESNPGSPAPLPEEVESNPGSPAPLPEEMESNPESPAPLPEEMESNPESPAPLPEEMESNPGSPAPLPEEMESSNPGFPAHVPMEMESSPPPLRVSLEYNLSPRPSRSRTRESLAVVRRRQARRARTHSPMAAANSSSRSSRGRTRNTGSLRQRRPRNQSVSPVRVRLSVEEMEISAGLPTSPIANVESNPSRSSRGRTRDIPTERRRRPRNRTPSPAENWEDSTVEVPMFDFDNNSTGPQFEIDATTSIIDVFNKLFPPHVIDYIVTSTNNYGRALCHTNRPMTRNSRRFRYKDTDPEEIKKFLGLCLLMGQVNVPKKSKLFTYSDSLYYHPIFPFTMSARRFEQILRCLYVSHVGAKGKEKINKFIDIMTKNFRDCYKPTRELSLDESMLLFRGRLSFRQYIKSKKARYGIKFYELTTSDGYVLNLQMYAGKEDSDIDERGKKTEKIVMRLMRPYLLKGHWLFMDNYYNSVSLSEKLLDLNTHTTGTLRKNRRDNPKDLISKKLKKNEHVWVRKNKVYVSKWHDKRSVLMVTTLNHPKLVEISNRRGQIRSKPEEVTTYNKFMSGIDRADQMVSYYSTPRKTLRWHKKVFFHLMDLAVWNSFFIYKKYCKNNSAQYEFLTFREDLIKSLIQLPHNLKPSNLISVNRFDNRLKKRTDFMLKENSENLPTTGHWPEKIPVRAGSKKNSNYMKCKMCSKKKVRRETSLRCKGCEEKPALCAVCFEEWHLSQ